MKVRFSRIALAELNSIFAALVAKDVRAAQSFELRILQISERIGQFPDGFQEVAERPGIRRVPLVRYPHVVYYKVVGGEVIVLRIVHGARREPWENL
jgi:plasmid stabilization system protein ParE